MKRLNNKPINMRRFACPQCEKTRMTRPLNHVVSKETKKIKIREGEEVELLIDICDNCVQKNYRDYFEPKRLDLKKILAAIKENKDLPDKQSLEELL